MNNLGHFPVADSLDSIRVKRRKQRDTVVRENNMKKARKADNVVQGMNDALTDEGEAETRTEVSEVLKALVSTVEATAKSVASHPACLVNSNEIVGGSTSTVVPDLDRTTSESETYVFEDNGKEKVGKTKDMVEMESAPSKTDTKISPLQLRRLKLTALRQMLRDRGLRVSGNKEDLIDRLLTSCN